ncbi:hypothetical protein HGRIS_012645 [Hohenbuehelia grisea]|uniref:Uncharacterized protein n=1 Tax=Hohenbuehelia grisea TaxID=104357 RepID=A0ABR3IT01_9AGAR
MWLYDKVFDNGASYTTPSHHLAHSLAIAPKRRLTIPYTPAPKRSVFTLQQRSDKEFNERKARIPLSEDLYTFDFPSHHCDASCSVSPSMICLYARNPKAKRTFSCSRFQASASESGSLCAPSVLFDIAHWHKHAVWSTIRL